MASDSGEPILFESSDMTPEVLTAIVSAACAVTASVVGGIVWLLQRKDTPSAPEYLSVREFDNFRNELRPQILAIQTELAFIRDHIT